MWVGHRFSINTTYKSMYNTYKYFACLSAFLVVSNIYQNYWTNSHELRKGFCIVRAFFARKKMQLIIFGKCASLKRKILVYKLVPELKVFLKKRYEAPWDSSIVKNTFCCLNWFKVELINVYYIRIKELTWPNMNIFFSVNLFLFTDHSNGKLTKNHDLTNKWRKKLLTGRTSFWTKLNLTF